MGPTETPPLEGGEVPADAATADERRRHWRGNLRLTAFCLAIWAVATFVPAYWAAELNRIAFFGWPLGFYMAAQGGPIVYVILIGLYALRMDRLDRRHRVAGREEEP